VTEETGCVAERALSNSLFDLNLKLNVCRDQRSMLEAILTESRAVTGAEAGCLFLAWNGKLKFVAAQIDRLNGSGKANALLREEIPVSAKSIVGFAMLTGQALNIPDAHRLPEGSPFHIDRQRQQLHYA
jgi:GAF domain-containing protein